ncbi:fatty-acid amide hydrolase 1 [Coccidioides immitis H538.4]|uniref:amidase n=1 Tax=Coccidioides immitis H538.4 TaxID=396776 RepID=A0A0J8RUE4_COCIT|nr:fatty-acid amide hydrolase 1 [Coccidioides immitis H538.4]
MLGIHSLSPSAGFGMANGVSNPCCPCCIPAGAHAHLRGLELWNTKVLRETAKEIMAKGVWENISAAKREALLSSIPPEWIIPANIIPPEPQNDVTPFPENSGWLTSEEPKITNTPAHEILDKTTSGVWTAEAVTRAFCKRAAAAHQLTPILPRPGSPSGPLHGLPISLKDNFNVIGKDSTLGFSAWVNDPATYNSVLTNLLRDAGAVLYVKTNVPTAMMIAETVNNVFGRTTNPRNRLLTSGGSSGGESALIAFGGSPLGVGTDIGGSLRIPAAVTVTNSQPWLKDPKCIPIPWRNVEPKKKLKIGIMWDDGMVRPTPPVRRALKETAEKLQKAGHEVVDWAPTGHDKANDILDRFFLSDGGKSVQKLLSLSDEPIRPEMERYGRAVDRGVYELWQLHAERNTLQKEYIDRWSTAGLDAILSVEHGKFKHVGYTGVYNILDYSCLSFPCNVTVDQAIDIPRTDEAPLSDVDEQVQKEYNPSAIHGMPVSLQLVGRRLEEEKVIMMGQVILKAL